MPVYLKNPIIDVELCFHWNVGFHHISLNFKTIYNLIGTHPKRRRFISSLYWELAQTIQIVMDYVSTYWQLVMTYD
jgi:hypothetical protein